MTWCTKGSAQPYTLWRYTGGANCSSPGGTKWVSNLVDNTSPSVAAGKIFKAGLVPAALLTPTTATGGTLQLGTYWYEVTAIVGGGEVPGVAASVSVASPNNAVTVSWPAYPSATSYNVYGRAGNGVRSLEERHRHDVSRPWTDFAQSGLARNFGHASQLDDPRCQHVELQLRYQHDRLRRVRRRYVHGHDLDELHRLQRRPAGSVPKGHAGRQRVELAAASRNAVRDAPGRRDARGRETALRPD